ncbi:Fic family protein [Burkholderia sp. AU6039]|uniref:Fic/DOC family protein n=1 Tax=Burkholderia sp. AU6039 TaxID=2015344 RepID=UPI000B7AC027|nr:Fic family protein [Burkholderia sp. AU6039]OXJ06546.1 cell filamentation protein Fic [Burkholderia sp. AU6039]
MFDPFRDFAQAGYLRNRYGEKDPGIVQELEHQLFRAGLDEAIAYLAGRRIISYPDFLEVHRILFHAFYPWAGQDRATTAPDIAVTKAGTWFSHPFDARRAVQEGLRIGHGKQRLRQRPGEVMGLFAYGHPFLDGNGRTMLVVHSELCHRAGFCIEWHRTRKTDYLAALSDEIASPGRGILDAYLLQFVGDARERRLWGGVIGSLPGLDGQGREDIIAGEYGDADVSQQYREFARRRGYQIGPDAGEHE